MVHHHLTTIITTRKLMKKHIVSRTIFTWRHHDLKIVVKRINYKRVDGTNASYYYIYKQWREGRKIKTKYIGKLEDIVNFYLTYHPLIENAWCGGWDSKPRRPTPADLESAAFYLARQPPPSLSFNVYSNKFVSFLLNCSLLVVNCFWHKVEE